MGKDDGDKQRALEAALAQIDRAFGKGSGMKLGDKGKIVEIESVSTGSLGLDMALGIGGLPARAGGGNLRPGKLRQDHPRFARGGRGAEARRHRQLHRRGTRAGPFLRPQARRETWTTCWSPQPDTGEQALEICDTLVALRRRGHHHHRLGGGPSPPRRKSKARWATACPAFRLA
ncbi:MAG: hypothetical protein WDN45_12110 [Caulobacteraceae bacterium]